MRSLVIEKYILTPTKLVNAYLCCSNKVNLIEVDEGETLLITLISFPIISGSNTGKAELAQTKRTVF